MLKKIRSIYHEYPQTFWLIMMGMFIDQLGGALIFPFFGLYITSKYSVGMTEVGILFSIVAVTGLFGSLIGGALADKFGRKIMILFGLVISAASTLLLAFAPSLEFIYLSGFIVGLFGNMAGPAHQAMITDVLPENKRLDGFGILRVIANLAAAIGPAIGGFLAARSYTLLFIIDVITSSITAIIIFALVPETKPKAKLVVNQVPVKEESLGKTLAGYLKVFKDGIFLVYLGASMFMVLAYMQMNTTLPVFLRDIHGLPESGYGLLLSMNAGMVVLFQFWITRRIKGFAPMKIMAWGMVIYAVGFSMYGFVSAQWLFVLAMVIITIAEMLVSPTGQAVVAKLSPEDMRGRYMAVFGFTWTIPTAIGPLLAGVVMDNYDPNWVWYGAGIFMLVSASIFAWLQLKASSRFENLENSETLFVEETLPA
ncbi:MAG: MFS transporter [Anaerolineales bacterium]|nr:MFS transporter [Anaerolineales bacterium]